MCVTTSYSNPATALAEPTAATAEMKGASMFISITIEIDKGRKQEDRTNLFSYDGFLKRPRKYSF